MWTWFLDLHNSRTSNGYGANPISYSDMKAYFDLFQITPNEHEVITLRQLDNIALKAFSDKIQKEQAKVKSK